MNYIMKDCNAFCIAFISLKLLLSKILLFSHFVGEPNYWSVEFHPRNSNSWTFLNLHILLFLLLYLYLILKDCLCLCCCKQLVPSHYVTHQFSSVAQLCPTLWDPMNHGMPGLPVHHQLPEFTQTHVHRVGDAIQPSHPLLSAIPPALNPSQHQSLFQWVNSAWSGQSTGVSALASFLPKNTQDWSLEWTGWISLQFKGLSRVFSNTTVQKHQFFSVQLSSQPNSHPYMTTGKTIALTRRTFVGKVTSLLLNMLSKFSSTE